jgi:hypothetical protein
MLLRPVCALNLLLMTVTAFAQLPVDNLEFLGHNGINGAHLMDIEVVGLKAYTSVGAYQGLETYDISNPYIPTRLGYNTPSNWRSRHYGDTLFVFNREGGLRIYNISGNTSQLGSCGSGGSNIYFEGGALIGSTLYVATHQNGMVSVNVGNLSNPYVTGTHSLTDNACWNAESSGDYLFIANGRFGLCVANTAGGFTEVTNLDLPGLANDIVLDGDVAVVALGPSGLATVDISDPENPVLLDIAPSMGCAWGMGIEDHQVIVGSWRVMELFDVSNPESIELTGWENTKTWAMGADIDPIPGGDIIAVSDWRGMSTFQIGIEAVPDIDVYPMRVDFGEVSTATDSTVIVRNSGGATLNVTSISTPGGINVQPSSFSLASGDSIEVVITATGSTVYGSITYYTNDPDETTFIQYVYANNTSFPQAGSIAPDFTLEGTDGNWYTLSELRGNVIFLEFGGGW